MATGINACINKDGSNAMTAALNLGTQKINNVVDPTADQDAATKKYVDDNFGAGLATDDELLIRLKTHTTIPSGFTIGTTDNKAVRINGNSAAAADAGSIAFDTALVSAHATVIATESAHTHTGSALTMAANSVGTTDLVQISGTNTHPRQAHTHTMSGSTGAGTAHRHSITLAVQNREFHTIVKT